MARPMSPYPDDSGVMVNVTRATKCQHCGTEHVATMASDYPSGEMPEEPPFWLVHFQPPRQGNVSFRQFMCDACAHKLGGPHLQRQLAKLREVGR